MSVASVLYFAYGTNLAREALVKQYPGADFLGVARLDGYRIYIAANGLATVEPQSEQDVWGALWLVPAKYLDGLNTSESMGAKGFVRTTAKVVTPAGPRVEVMLYKAADSAQGEPTDGYLAGIVAAAKELRLDAVYQRRLRGLGK